MDSPSNHSRNPASAAVLMEMSKSQDPTPSARLAMISNESGLSEVYRRNYAIWIEELLEKNEKVKKEVDSVSKKPLDSEGLTEIIFSENNGLPGSLEIIPGNGETVVMRIKRGTPANSEDEVTITTETYVPDQELITQYANKGMNFPAGVEERDETYGFRILKAVVVYNIKTLKIVAQRDSHD